MPEEKKLTGYPSIDKPWLKYYSEKAKNASLPKCTIYEYIRDCNNNRMENSAINYFGKKYTYQQLFSSIEITVKAFTASGVKTGDVVSLCMLSMPKTVYSIYALNRLGAVCNIIEPRTNADLIKERIKSANSTVLIVVDIFLNKIINIANETSLERVVVVPLSNSMPYFTKVAFSLTKGREISDIPKENIYLSWQKFIELGENFSVNETTYQKNMPVAIIYTGGTTGISKGAVLSNDCLTAMVVETYFAAPRLFTGKSFLEIMPPFIAYGLVYGFLIPFCAGLENKLIPVFEPKNFAKLVIKQRPNHVIGVPSFFESLANSKKLNNCRIDFLTSMIAGGDKMLINTEEHINKVFKEHGCNYQITKGYGMTEMGSAATFTISDECNIYGSVGIPLIFTTVKIVNPETYEELKYGETGEICMTGPTMMLGYYKNDSETKKVIREHKDGNKWIHSGDIGYMTEDGVIFIVDRMKRMIIRPDGHNVWPSQIESVIASHPLVLDCAVVGLKSKESENGKIPTAFVVVKEGVNATQELINDIDKFSKRHLPERDTAMAYQFCEKLPLTLVGKVDYLSLEKQNL